MLYHNLRFFEYDLNIIRQAVKVAAQRWYSDEDIFRNVSFNLPTGQEFAFYLLDDNQLIRIANGLALMDTSIQLNRSEDSTAFFSVTKTIEAHLGRRFVS